MDMFGWWMRVSGYFFTDELGIFRWVGIGGNLLWLGGSGWR